MVGAALPYKDQGSGRWALYLLLSLCVNGMIVSHMTLEKLEAPILEVPVLQVNLMTLAKPLATPKLVSVPEPAKVVEPQKVVPVITKPIVLEKRAEKKTVAHVAAPKPREKPSLNLPEAKKIIAKEPLVEPEKLPEKPMNEDVQPTKKVSEITVAKPTPDKPVPRNTDVTLSEASGATGQNKSTVIQEAKYRHQTPPIYPRRALDMGQQGTVTLHAKVLPNGSPGELKVARSSGHRLLDRAAMAAVKKWKFEPTSVGGTATVSWVRVPVNFVIQ
ncbi:MAG: energy transducer TonB [Proteobacteria bacterium]|nr:energy transducer TonB [Pseudomonadota bacterium]